MKHLFICLASLVMFMSSLGFFTYTVSAAEQTYQQQEAQINKKFQQEILKQTNTTEKQNMQNEYNKYKRLSLKDKKKFVAYMNNPKVMADLLQNMQSSKSGVRSTPYSGVTVSSTNSYESASSSAQSFVGTKYRTAVWRGVINFQGIKVFEVTGKVSYSYIKGIRVTKVSRCDSYVSRNFNPTLTWKWGTCKRGMDKHHAWMTNTITWRLAPNGRPLPLTTHKMSVSGTHLPTTHGYIKKM